MAPPVAFAEQVKDALEHLYDLASLNEHPLGRDLLPVLLPVGLSPAHALRQAILDAIHDLQEELSPGLAGRPGRLCHILELRYVESLPYREVMSELGLSQSQYHREQRRAVEALATLLWERSRRDEPSEASGPVPPGSHPWKDELEAVAQGPEMSVDLTELVGGVVRLLERVAGSSGVVFESGVAGNRLAIDGNRTMLRQLLIVACLYLLRAARGGRLAISCAVQDAEVRFTVSYRGSFAADRLLARSAREQWAEGGRLLSILKGSWALEEEAASATLSIHLTRPCHQLLVIDDNPDMVQLIARFVSGQGYTVLGAHGVDEGIALARQHRPRAIILDVMMPERDGWDALQVLKNHPATESVPVVVCTILAESELALALGAQGFLRKPITRPRLLESLRCCTQ